MVEIILTLAGEFRGIKNLSRTTDSITGETLYKFEGYIGTGKTRIWKVPVSQVIAKGYEEPSYASEKSNVSPTDGQLEYFVFGKCQGLALDGSLGLGEYRDRKSFDEYVAWYNNTKLTNSKWISMKETGDIYKAPTNDLPF